MCASQEIFAFLQVCYPNCVNQYTSLNGSSTVDQDKKRSIEGRIADAEQQYRLAEEEIKNYRDRISEVEHNLGVANTEKGKIKARAQAVQNVQRRIHQLNLKLGMFHEAYIPPMLIVSFSDKLKGDVVRERNRPSMDQERQTLRNKLFDIAKRRAGIANELHVCCCLFHMSISPIEPNPLPFRHCLVASWMTKLQPLELAWNLYKLAQTSAP